MVVSTPSFPVQVFLGIYLGILTGIIPALVAWAMAFTFKYITGLTVPSFAVVVLGVAIAGINGGFLAFNDPTVLQSANSVSLVTAILVVMLISFYTHNMGDKLGTTLPRRLTFGGLRERTLARDVVELVEGRNRVRLRVVGAIENMEGYPPLGPDLKSALSAEVRDWTFPADQSIDELEITVADRLREEFDLSGVTVTIDERARATVSAAPPFSGVSKTVPPGRRAATVRAVLPTGLAPGDEVSLVPLTGEDSVASDTEAPIPAEVMGSKATESEPSELTTPSTETEDAVEAPTPTVPVTSPGGEGRLTVTAEREAAQRIVDIERCGVIVRSRGISREFELLSLLRRAGQRIRRLTVRQSGPLDGVTLGEADVRERHGVAILALRHGGDWRLAPRGETPISAGDDIFAVGSRDALDLFQEAVT